ncbi:hypothetical protein [Thermosporothrix hazakensis]|nr:hypothetical protein [Thermosporothrix hazakensis]
MKQTSGNNKLPSRYNWQHLKYPLETFCLGVSLRNASMPITSSKHEQLA